MSPSTRVALLALLCPGLSGAARAETIEAALAKAYAANAQLEEQRAGVRVRDEDVPKAKTGWRPKASISINGGPQRTWTRQPAGLDQFHNRLHALDKYSGIPKNGTASITQPIFDGGKTTSAVRQAESEVRAARENLRQSEQEALLNAATAYMNVLRDSAVVSLRKNNIAVLIEQLRVARDRAELGEVTTTDVAQAEAALAQARADHAAALGALENSVAVYVQTIGDKPERLAPAKKIDALLPLDRAQAIETALLDHPGVAAAQHQVDAAEQAVKVAESVLMPTAAVGAQIVQQYDSYLAYPGTKQLSAQIFGQLNIPLYQGGGEYSGVRQAKEQASQARLHVTVMQNAVRAGVIQAFSQFTTARAAVSFNEVAVRSAETALAGVRNEAAFGQRTTLDVLNAQQALLNARVNLVTAQRDRMVGSYALLAATGLLSASTLDLDVVPYDPALHLDEIESKWFGLSVEDGR